MAARPKAQATAKSTMSAIVRHEVVPFDNASLAGDSGWRELDPERVDELVNMIVEGNWGCDQLGRTQPHRRGR